MRATVEIGISWTLLSEILQKTSGIRRFSEMQFQVS
jgi:hypothetical protein